MPAKVKVDINLLRDLYSNQFHSAPQISKELSISTHLIYDELVRANIPTRSISEALKLGFKQGRLNLSGEHSHNWKGGRRLAQGYIYLLQKEHPRANNRGYVLEHILVLEQKLGHPLKANEIGHHLNGIRSDNRPENLIALPKKGEGRHHGYLVMRAQQQRIKELEVMLNACPRF